MNTILQSYVMATSGAVVTALSLNRLFRNAPPLVGRLVPFAAVAAANCVNIPFMRISELQNGIELQTEDGKRVGTSKKAAKKAIVAVTLSRILMASPSMRKKFFLQPEVTLIEVKICQKNHQVFLSVSLLQYCRQL